MAFLDTPQSTFDPYEQDRMQRMDMLKQAQSDFGANMQAPMGFLDPEMQRFLESKTREDVRSANPRAGGSGWLQDREATEMLKLRMGMLDKNLQESNNQRNYMAQLAGIQQPQQQVSGETGMLSTAGADIMGTAMGGMGAGLGKGLGDLFGSMFGGGKRAPQNTNEPGQNMYAPGSYGMAGPDWRG